MSRTKYPRFITVEGGEGAGKSTLLEQLERTLTSWGYPVVRTREPGGTPFGNRLRELLLSAQNASEKIAPQTELLLFLAARYQHIEEVIAPAIHAQKIVLCDRFNDSSIAYQGAGRQLGIPFVKQFCHKVCGAVKPDLTFYLDVDPKIGLQRTQKEAKEHAPTGKVDRIEAENLEFHEAVRNAFLTLVDEEPHRFYCINANQPQKDVLHEALAFLSTCFDR